MTTFSQLLNSEQCEAATAGDGPILVLAAAGTGKTRTLVHRVAYLIEQGVPPDRILLLTFTNRAAREMMERAQKVVGDAASAVWAGTFHSICARFLRRYGAFLGYQPGFAILDDEDQKKLIAEIIKKKIANPKDFPKKEIVLKMISEAANERKPIEAVAARWQTKAAGFAPEEIAVIADAYRARKRELGAMDFDDLLVNGLALLKQNERVCEIFQEHFLHILVDEYQDTNGLQAEFTDLLAAKHRNILVVGDDFQCIYTWRGAQIENILKFPDRWANCHIVKLERNYRSVPGVLHLANEVMKDAAGKFDKKLRPFRAATGVDDKPWLYSVYDGHAQASEIVRLITEAREAGYRYSDLAILYRSHYQSVDVQMMLTRMNVPFRITSGVGFFEQVHVKDVLAYVRLLVSPDDELSFMRFVSLLPSVGEASARKYWDKLDHHFNPTEPKEVAKLGDMLGTKARVKWPALTTCFQRAREHLAANEMGLIVEDFIQFFYSDYALNEWEEQNAEDRLADVEELAVQIADAKSGLEEFLQNVALLTNLDARKNSDESDRITLSTVHQAKGMEWPVVYVPWCSAGKFPSAKAVEENRLDEERRLFYVALTRAKDKLYLFAPNIDKRADGAIYPIEPSVFIKDISEHFIQKRRVQSGYGMRDFPVRENFYGARVYGGNNYGNKPVYKTTWRR